MGEGRARTLSALCCKKAGTVAGSSPAGSQLQRAQYRNGNRAHISTMVGAVGLEPTIPKAEDFKSPAYANSATPPQAESVPRATPSSAVSSTATTAANRDATVAPQQRTSAYRDAMQCATSACRKPFRKQFVTWNAHFPPLPAQNCTFARTGNHRLHTGPIVK